MIEVNDQQTLIEHPRAAWRAVHDEGKFGGPHQLFVNGQELARVQALHADDMQSEAAICNASNASRRSGSAVMETKGVFPFGHELQFSQTCRYAATQLRVTTDVVIPKGFQVERHFGIGSLFLPGKWTSMYCIPPVQHLLEGASAFERNLDPEDTDQMIAHWHRPPLALVFKREDGMELETGVGSDVWRWEKSLGYGPESGSYKIFVREDGIEFLREPLMCCESFTPPPGPYRFSWYLAWTYPGSELDYDAASSRFFSPDHLALPDDACRAANDITLFEGNAAKTACWTSSPTQKAARRYIRQQREQYNEKPFEALVFNELLPGICTEPQHLRRGASDLAPHWDLVNILDFATWAKQQLRETCKVCIHPNLQQSPLPSIRGLAIQNGFAV